MVHHTQITMLAGLTLLASSLAIGCGPEYPNCGDDGDCHEGEFCVNGLCQMCRSDADCQPGQACVGGRCDPIPGYCQSAADCPPGQECQNNRCMAPVTSGEQLDGDPTSAGPCTLQVIFFAFDADELDASARNGIQANVSCMRERGLSGLHLTGHCDPRGTEEYNLALGDRRARAVLQYMTSLGVERDSLGVSSMGEEMSQGTDESSWSRDRKVEFTGR